MSARTDPPGSRSTGKRDKTDRNAGWSGNAMNKKILTETRNPHNLPVKVCAACGRYVHLAQKVGTGLGKRALLLGQMPQGGRGLTATMFDIVRRKSFTRRLLEARSRIDRVHCLWPSKDALFVEWKDYYKFIPDRREHPAYYIRRIVHPRFRHAHHYRGKILLIQEAWSNKTERNSPRAMPPLMTSASQ